jgi:hypothetical protein
MRGEVAPHRRAISGKDHCLAMLAACGVYSWGEIAAATGISAKEIEAKAQNVNFQALVQEYGRRFGALERDELDVVRTHREDACKTLQFLRDVRDGKHDELAHTKLGIRVAAARTLCATQVTAPPAAVERPVLPPLDTKRRLMLERILQDDMTEGRHEEAR